MGQNNDDAAAAPRRGNMHEMKDARRSHREIRSAIEQKLSSIVLLKVSTNVRLFPQSKNHGIS